MYDENLHMTNDGAKDFPDPEITADEAWNEMKSMLDAEMPHLSNPSAGEILKGGLGHFLNSMVLVLGTAGALTLAILLFIHRNDNSAGLSEPGSLAPDSALIMRQDAGSDLFLKEDLIKQQRSVPEKTETGLKNDEENQSEIQENELFNKPQESVINNLNLEIPDIDQPSPRQDSGRNTQVIADVLPGNDKKAGNLSSGDSVILHSPGSGKMDQKITQNGRDREISASDTKPVKNKTGRSKTRLFNVGARFGKNIHYGLQWGIPLPVQGTRYYFSGFDGKAKPYLSFIPGAWISYRSEKSEMMFQFHPFNQNYTGSREIVPDGLNNGNMMDSMSMLNKAAILHKTSGAASVLQYNYFLNRKWFIGAGIGFNFQTKALLEERITSRTNGVVLSDSLYSIGKSSPSWNHLSSVYYTGKLEIARATKNIDIGMNLTLPFTGLLRGTGQNLKPLNGQVFLRLKIK